MPKWKFITFSRSCVVSGVPRKPTACHGPYELQTGIGSPSTSVLIRAPFGIGPVPLFPAPPHVAHGPLKYGVNAPAIGLKNDEKMPYWLLPSLAMSAPS